ncbi:MAG: RNA polymerase factor sigma-54 [Planctomycetota bacterium]
MRLGLQQSLRAEQRLVQSPQMIQAMQILQCPTMELKDQIEQELQENVFLETALEQEREERSERGEATAEAPESLSLEEKLQRQYANELEQLELRTERVSRVRRDGGEEGDRKIEVLNNTPDSQSSLAEHLLEQVRMMEVADELFRVVEHVVYSLDDDGRLAENTEQIAADLLVPIPLAEQAVELVRELDPAGVGAANLKDCLLLQLHRLSYVRPLTQSLVAHHLDDLAMNRLPKIAKATGATLEEIKESWVYLRNHLNPHPGRDFTPTRNATVIPDVTVDEVDGRFEVLAQRGSIPELAISPVYRSLLKEARSDPKVYEYLRRKIDAAKWFIEAVHQRQSTIQRIASEVVERQQEFLRHGVQHLRPMKMQDVADAVGVHISTVSRAISAKYIQTPQGIFEMKRFFSGGTVTDSGEVVSQQAIKDKLRKIVEDEDKSAPLSDDQLVEALSGDGVHIARRTVTKYRKALGIAASSRRKQF